MTSFHQKRLNSALNSIKINKLELKLDNKFFDKSFISINENNSYEVKIDEVSEENYDSQILELYNMDMKRILNEDKDITQFIRTSFYGNHLVSKFVSSRVIRDVINKLFLKTTFIFENREIVIFSEKAVKKELVDKIDTIFNFFDSLTGKKNKYYIQIFLCKKKKFFNKNLDSLNPDNINSGATLPGSYIIIWRYEEIFKVIIHELVHYLNLDMINYQDKFKQMYKEINLKATIVNPNEAYTELLALLFLSLWNFYITNTGYKIDEFVNTWLTIELGWSYHQIAKVLKYFKCYSKYEDLYTSKCEFRQNSNVLSYFIMKTYFLQNINKILSNFSFDNLYMNRKSSDYIFSNTNLKDPIFKNNINRLMEIDFNENIYELYSSRMTCLD